MKKEKYLFSHTTGSHAKPTMHPNLYNLYQHYESLVLQHKKRADKTAEIEPRYNRLTNKNNQN